MPTRRQMLISLPGIAIAGISGCMQRQAYHTPTPVVENFNGQVTSQCASERRGRVRGLFNDETERVEFDGVLITPTPCQEADVVSTSYDEGTDTIRVDIQPVQTTANGCNDCIGEIEYSGELRFKGQPPTKVHIVQAGQGNGEAVVRL